MRLYEKQTETTRLRASLYLCNIHMKCFRVTSNRATCLPAALSLRTPFKLWIVHILRLSIPYVQLIMSYRSTSERNSSLSGLEPVLSHPLLLLHGYNCIL